MANFPFCCQKITGFDRLDVLNSIDCCGGRRVPVSVPSTCRKSFLHRTDDVQSKCYCRRHYACHSMLCRVLGCFHADRLLCANLVSFSGGENERRNRQHTKMNKAVELRAKSQFYSRCLVGTSFIVRFVTVSVSL